jgi:hypothetical protein
MRVSFRGVDIQKLLLCQGYYLKREPTRSRLKVLYDNLKKLLKSSLNEWRDFFHPLKNFRLLKISLSLFHDEQWWQGKKID